MLFASEETEQYLIQLVSHFIADDLTKGSYRWFETSALQFSCGSNLIIINSFNIKLIPNWRIFQQFCEYLYLLPRGGSWKEVYLVSCTLITKRFRMKKYVVWNSIFLVSVMCLLLKLKIFCLKDGAYYCYCAHVLRISRYSSFLSVMLTNTGIFLRGLKLSGESR